MSYKAMKEISKIEITGLIDEGLIKVTFSGLEECKNPIIFIDKKVHWDNIYGIPAKRTELDTLNISLQCDNLRCEEKLVSKDDGEALYELVVNSELPLSTLMAAFGQAIDTITNRGDTEC